MKLCRKYLFGIYLFLVLSCSMDEDPGVGLDISTKSYDFNFQDYGWQSGFSDYLAADSALYQLHAEYTDSPDAVEGNGLKIEGTDRNRDLFMFLKKKISGLEPDVFYTLTVEVYFASEARPGLVNTGESVFMKVGAATHEPKSLLDDNGYYTMNIDKGEGEEHGSEMVMIGNISAPDDANGYTVVSRSNLPYSNNNSTGIPTVSVKANGDGELWMIVGTDSEFNGTTTLFYNRINLVLTKSGS